MLIKILHPQYQTILFAIIFLPALLISLKINRNQAPFSIQLTNQLKGVAILAIIFSHIGYFLSSDNQFLYPFSILAGVGVNAFLFLSGFGLTVSQLHSKLSPLAFYQKRLSKLFIPLWLTISLILIIDFLLLHKSYPLSEITSSYLGFFPKADLFQNLNSPLWYFSIIFTYYLIFPLTFVQISSYLAPLLILGTTLLLLNLPLPIDHDLIKLYKLHSLAFPLGVSFALIIQKIKFSIPLVFRYFLLIICVMIFVYTAINSYVGQDAKLEQTVSLITFFSLVAIFVLSKINSKLLSVFGIFSYEIYLIHWPIVSRFDVFFALLPPFLATALYLVLFILLGFLIQKVVKTLSAARKYLPY